MKYTPKPRPIRPSNPSALELAIYRYECQAAEYHDKKNSVAPNNESKEACKQRIDALKKDWAHLQHERKKITAQVMLQ
ncbi:TPA: hypothetical protein ACPJ0A_000610 [Vibrio diabolicus]